VPVTKSWKDLGFKNVEEPPDTFPDARQWFNDQPRETKLRIMGPERLKRLEAGDIGWDDMSQLKTTHGWRDSYHIKPL
jgi:hypothetical protein